MFELKLFHGLPSEELIIGDFCLKALFMMLFIGDKIKSSEIEVYEVEKSSV